jgi:LAGLIDADG endonuclease
MISITKSKSYKTGYQVRPIFVIYQNVRNKNLLEAISIALGCGQVKLNKKGKTPNEDVYELIIHNNSDFVNIIAPLLDANHLVLSKRVHNYNLIKQYINLIKINKHNTKKGLALANEIQSSLHPKIDSSLVSINSSFESFNEQWLTGLIDGESSFNVSITPNKTSKLGLRVVVNFTISQERLELPVLNKILSFFNCGTIPPKLNQPNAKVFEFRITGLNDLTNILFPFLDKNLLQSTKREDYNKFKRIVNILVNNKPLTMGDLHSIKSIAESMNRKTIRKDFPFIDSSMLND